jgi:hypothetical protein
MIDPSKIKRRIDEISASLQAWHALTTKDRARLTKLDRRRTQEIEVELQAILEPAARSELIVDVHMVARFFGVSVRSISVWSAQKGCPKLKHGHYDLLAVFTWWNDNINGGDSEATENVKLEYWRWKTENEKMKAQQTSGELLKQEEVFQFWANRLRGVWSALYVLENRLPAVLVGKSQSQMQEVIKAEVRRINEGYCKEGKFCRVKRDESKLDGIPPRKRGRPRKK